MNIIDHKGAEKLKGYGDAIVCLNQEPYEVRTQIAFAKDEIIQNITNHWRKECEYYKEYKQITKNKE